MGSHADGSLAVPQMRHATSPHLHMDWLGWGWCNDISCLAGSTRCYATVRHRIFSCTFTHTGCYVKGFFLLHSHEHWMLRHRIFSCREFSPKHMRMKRKKKGHAKMHPSVPDYIYMWCWRQSLGTTKPWKFLTKLEELL